MLKRTVLIENPCYLALRLNQMILSFPNNVLPEKVVPIEDLGILICEHPQITITNTLIDALLKNNTIIIHCDKSNYMPVGYNIPIQGNTLQSERVKHQVNISIPLKKNLWQQTIKAKIKNQRLLMEARDIPCAKMKKWEQEVLSGDTNNHESRAAVFYWSKLFNKAGFLRSPDGAPPNHLLNYGYAILRSVAARSIVGAGLFPTLGIFHKNKYNAFCLADDIMEPYRPFVDQLVWEIIDSGADITTLLRSSKIELLKVPVIDVTLNKTNHPLQVAMAKTALSLVDCYSGKRKSLDYPIMRN
jgi:CRISPR-associated protein Cas1